MNKSTFGCGRIPGTLRNTQTGRITTSAPFVRHDNTTTFSGHLANLLTGRVPEVDGESPSGSFVTVFVWVSLVKAVSPGHAAISLHPEAKIPEEGYVSFAPLEEGSISGPGCFYPKNHDMQHYGSIESPPGERRGVWTANLYGLDVNAMYQQLRIDLKNVPHYSISNECATTVHRYLQIGGGDQFASWWSRNVLGFWSPDDVEDYARSIAENTRNLGSNFRKHSGQGTLWSGSSR